MLGKILTWKDINRTSFKKKCHNISLLVVKEVVCQAGLEAEVKLKCSVYRFLRRNERKKKMSALALCFQGFTALQF